MEIYATEIKSKMFKKKNQICVIFGVSNSFGYGDWMCLWRRSIIRFTIRLNVCAFASFWVERKHKQKTEAFVVNSNWNELKIVRVILQLDLLD